uniref:DNA-directed RNA polymerase n=1 Tax=Siphoviridae sp. ct3Mm15 TaxID=2827558 RepID=A0A8S5RSV6_9CAUD|nr:MAG TPA: DNA-directed RNA polymerase [Siphoviridae sp. ct3Mm15]
MPTPAPICPITGKPLHHNQTIHPDAARQHIENLQAIYIAQNELAAATLTHTGPNPTSRPHTPTTPINLHLLTLLQQHEKTLTQWALRWGKHINHARTHFTTPLLQATFTLGCKPEKLPTWEHAPQMILETQNIAQQLLAATYPTRSPRTLTICACPNCQTTYTTPTPQNPHTTTHCPNCHHATPTDEASQTAITLALTKPLPIPAAQAGLTLINPETHIGKASIYKAIQKNHIPHTENEGELRITIQALIDYLDTRGHKN